MRSLAEEYGRALYELAAEEDVPDSILEELGVLAQCFAQEPDFLRLLDCRAIDIEERLGVLEDAFAGKVQPYLMNFMMILCRRGAMHAFDECAAAYRHLFNRDFGLTEARVTTAVPLTDAQTVALRKRLEQISGKRVSLLAGVDPQLIGGVRVEMDGRRLDNTLKMQLEQLRRSLTANI